LLDAIGFVFFTAPIASLSKKGIGIEKKGRLTHQIYTFVKRSQNTAS
jgi:hypothetical protein